MRDDLVEIVERELDSKVIVFMSQNQIDPYVAVEVFVLEPAEAVYRGNAAPELVTPPPRRPNDARQVPEMLSEPALGVVARMRSRAIGP